MIIDSRIRPPFGGFLNLNPYNPNIVGPLAKALGLKTAISGKNRSADEMVTEMKAAGIDKGIIVGRQSPKSGSLPNDDIVTFLSQYPGKFIGIGGIHPLPLDNAIKEIERCIKVLNFAGIALEPGVASPPMFPNDKNFYPIYDTCQKFEIPVFMTISGWFGPNIGYSDPIFIDQVAADFPNLKIVVAHAAYPFVTTMLFSALRRPNIYLLPDLYVPYVPGGNEYVVAANLFLEDRLLFGSAYPIASFESILDGYRKMPFKKVVLEKVLYHNAARLFKME